MSNCHIFATVYKFLDKIVNKHLRRLSVSYIINNHTINIYTITIGNAVPSYLGYYLAKKIMEDMKSLSVVKEENRLTRVAS